MRLQPRCRVTAAGLFFVRRLTLSVRLSAASSPKGGASDETGNFAWTAKASPFGRGGIAPAMTERVRLLTREIQQYDKMA